MMSLEDMKKARELTEKNWYSFDKGSAVVWEMRGILSDRKLRLIACGWFRELWDRLDDGGKEAVRQAERMAEGKRVTGFVEVPGIGWKGDWGRICLMARWLQNEDALEALEMGQAAMIEGWAEGEGWKRIGFVLREMVRNPWEKRELPPVQKEWRELAELVDAGSDGWELRRGLARGLPIEEDGVRLIGEGALRCGACWGTGKVRQECGGLMVTCAECDGGWVYRSGVRKGNWVIDWLLGKG